MSDTAPSRPQHQAKLVAGSIPRHLIGQTLPMIIGVAAMMSIGLVDAYFIGQLGSEALAAISFIFPISVAITSLGVGVMVGINSVVARALGENDLHKAARRANLGIVFALVCGAVMGFTLYVLLDSLFALMNASPELLPIIKIYMEPFALGFPIMLAIMGLNGVMRGQGEARKTSIVSLAYAAANWVLDPILITGAFGFEGLGMVGAAYATIAGWAVGVVTAVLLISRTSIPINPALMFKGQILEPLSAILKVGIPASLSNAINPMGLSVLTAIVALQDDAAVAGFGAAGRVQSFAVVPLLALSGSIGAIVGQNWGAQQFDRAREAALYAGGFCVAWGLLIAIAMIAGGHWLAVMFTNDPEVIAEFELYVQIAAWGYAGFGLLIVGNGILNAVDHASFALAQSLLRVFAVMLPFALFLSASWGSSAVYAAELTANLFGAVSAIVLIRYVIVTRAAA